jgi:hypothetical protein
VLEEVEACRVVHLERGGQMEAPRGGSQPGAPETKVRGPDEGEGNAGIDASTDGGVWAAPLFGEVGGETLEEGFGLTAEKAIGRSHKWNKVTAVEVAGAGILAFLFFLTGAEGSGSSSGAVGVTV